MRSSWSATTKRSWSMASRDKLIGAIPAERASKKVLVLAYRFPPQGGGGVQRTLKFVKYLPASGWQPVVHTVSNPYWALRDPTLLDEVPPSTAIYRTPTFEFERLGHAVGTLVSHEAPQDTPRKASGPSEHPAPRQGV